MNTLTWPVAPRDSEKNEFWPKIAILPKFRIRKFGRFVIGRAEKNFLNYKICQVDPKKFLGREKIFKSTHQKSWGGGKGFFPPWIEMSDLENFVAKRSGCYCLVPTHFGAVVLLKDTSVFATGGGMT